VLLEQTKQHSQKPRLLSCDYASRTPDTHTGPARLNGLRRPSSFFLYIIFSQHCHIFYRPQTIYVLRAAAARLVSSIARARTAASALTPNPHSSPPPPVVSHAFSSCRTCAAVATLRPAPTPVAVAAPTAVANANVCSSLQLLPMKTGIQTEISRLARITHFQGECSHRRTEEEEEEEAEEGEEEEEEEEEL
jgi:hypothetical protein